MATELFAWEALRRVIYDLPMAVQEGANLAARTSMAWADTLAGMSICRAGVTLPHGIAMAVGGMFPNTLAWPGASLGLPRVPRVHMGVGGLDVRSIGTDS